MLYANGVIELRGPDQARPGAWRGVCWTFDQQRVAVPVVLVIPQQRSGLQKLAGYFKPDRKVAFVGRVTAAHPEGLVVVADQLELAGFAYRPDQQTGPGAQQAVTQQPSAAAPAAAPASQPAGVPADTSDFAQPAAPPDDDIPF